MEYCSNKIETRGDDFEALVGNELNDEIKEYDTQANNGQQQTSTTSNDEELNKIMQEINR